MTLKAVFFDLDGTLAETEILHLECFNFAFKECNLPFTWDNQIYSQLLSIGGGQERIEYYIKNYTSLTLDLHQIYILHQIKSQCYKERLQSPIPLRPGIIRLLKELNQKSILTALVTTSSKTSTNSFLKSSLPPFIKFDLILTGDDIKNKKPDPEIYQKGLEYFSLSPKEVIAIEDSRTGLLSAHLNQIRVLITPSFFTQNHNFQEAYSVISHLGEPDLPFQHLLNHTLQKSYIDLEVLKNIVSN